jgi:hypothetical protein
MGSPVKMFSGKKKEWCNPQVWEELQSYFAPWQVKSALAVR